MRKLLNLLLCIILVCSVLLCSSVIWNDQIKLCIYNIYDKFDGDDVSVSGDLDPTPSVDGDKVEIKPTPSILPVQTEVPSPTPSAEEIAMIKYENDNTFIFTDEFTSLDYDLKIKILQLAYPEGKYWNTAGVDTTNMSDEEVLLCVCDYGCNHDYFGYGDCQVYNGKTKNSFSFSLNRQCLAFASLLSDVLFGKDKNVIEISDKSDLQIGDHIRLTSWEHSFVIIDIDDENVTVAEVNQDYETCQISWDRKISLDWFDNQAYRILRRA